MKEFALATVAVIFGTIIGRVLYDFALGFITGLIANWRSW